MTTITVECEPCKEDDKQVTAIAWCRECQETLCASCEDVHKRMKMLKHHRVIDIKLMHSIGKTDKYCKDHSDHKIDHFCTAHDELCCSLCRSDKHKSCETLVPLDEKSKNVRKSDQFNSISKNLYGIVNAMKSVKKIQEKNMQSIINDEIEIRKEFSDIKQHLIDHLNKFEKNLHAELTNKKEQAASEISNISDAATKLDIAVKDELGKVKFIKNYGTDKQALLFSHRVKSDLLIMKQKVVDIASKCKNYNIVFDDSSIRAIKLPEVFGSVEVTTKSVQQAVPIAPEGQHHPKADAHHIKHVNKLHLMHKFDISSPGKICGIAVSDDNHILICNAEAKLLVKYDPSGKILKQLEMKYPPNNVAVIPKTNNAVVTLPDVSAMEFIAIDTFTEIKTVKLPDEGKGISASSDKIVVGGVKVLFIFDTDGQHLQTVNVKSNFSRSLLFLSICSNETIIYTDIYKVYRVSMDGQLLWEYGSHDLKTPAGITTDISGRVYVVDKDTNTVIRLYGNGQFHDHVLTKKDGLDSPYNIAFNQNGDRLFLSNKHGKTINMFKYTTA